MEETDIALMARIKMGDAKAFEVLLARHQKSVFNLALRFLGDPDEAEDIMQNTFLRILKASRTYTPEAKFTTWLYTIVKNLCFNVLRSRKSVELVSMDNEYLPDLPATEENPIARISQSQLRETVIGAIGKLPKNMQMAVILSKYHGLQYDEIAAIMGCSVNAVKLRVHRAKLILAQELKGLKQET
ncbi:MAG: RNA polymerase sigma factor [Nitrospirae bacterium]|nr:RNA polymerase sigma factor [Nitrospirota bacterium]